MIFRVLVKKGGAKLDLDTFVSFFILKIIFQKNTIIIKV